MNSEPWSTNASDGARTGKRPRRRGRRGRCIASEITHRTLARGTKPAVVRLIQMSMPVQGTKTDIGRYATPAYNSRKPVRKWTIHPMYSANPGPEPSDCARLSSQSGARFFYDFKMGDSPRGGCVPGHIRWQNRLVAARSGPAWGATRKATRIGRPVPVPHRDPASCDRHDPWPVAFLARLRNGQSVIRIPSRANRQNAP